MRKPILGIVIASVGALFFGTAASFAQDQPPEPPANPPPDAVQDTPTEPQPPPPAEEPKPPSEGQPQETPTPPEPTPVPPPQPAAPSPTLPPVAPQPAPPPVVTSPPPAGTQADAEVAWRPYASSFAVEAQVAGMARIGSLSSGYDSSGRSGMLVGGGVFFSPARLYSVGLVYDYATAGREKFEPGITQSSAELKRFLHLVNANLRLYPLRSDRIGLWGGLMIGVAWQTAEASGTSVSGMPAIGHTYQADVGPDAGLSLGAGLGMDVDLAEDVGFLTSVTFMNHRLSSDPLEGHTDPQIPGMGTTSQLDLRLAFQYRFDASSVTGTRNVAQR